MMVINDSRSSNVRLRLDLSTTLADARFGRDDGGEWFDYSTYYFFILSEAKNLNLINNK